MDIDSDGGDVCAVSIDLLFRQISIEIKDGFWFIYRFWCDCWIVSSGYDVYDAAVFRFMAVTTDN